MVVHMGTNEPADEGAKLERVYEAYKSLIYYAAMRLTEDEAAAQEIVCSTLERIADRIGEIPEAVSPETQKRILAIVEREAALRGITPPCPITPGGSENRFAACMAKLPELDRKLIYLKYRQGFGYAQIADLLGLTDEDAQVLTLRARDTLASLCREEGLL